MLGTWYLPIQLRQQVVTDPLALDLNLWHPAIATEVDRQEQQLHRTFRSERLELAYPSSADVKPTNHADDSYAQIYLSHRPPTAYLSRQLPQLYLNH